MDDRAFAPLSDSERRAAGKVTLPLKPELLAEPFPGTDEEASRAILSLHARQGQPTAGFGYRDSQGRALGSILRFDRADGKHFLPAFHGVSGEGKPGWHGRMPSSNRPLFHLHELAASTPAQVVVVHEGEACAEAAAKALPEFVNVTSMAGANSAHLTDWRPMQGRDIVIFPDGNQAGRQYRDAVGNLCKQAGGRSIRSVQSPPGAPENWDFAWALKNGWSVDELRKLIIGARSLAEPPKEPIEQALDQLAMLPPMEYDRIRVSEAERLGVRVGTLDCEVVKRRPVDVAQTAGQGQPLVLSDPTPWPDPVDGAAFLNALLAAFERFLALPQHAAQALALWVLHAFSLPVATTNPRLAITSPQKRCGKTTLIAVLSKLVPRPLPAANITPAAVYRAIEACAPTLLLDEADTFLGDNNELRGVLNSGHTRATAFIIRSVGDDHEPRRFATWCPMAIAAIGRLPATLMDRSIIIEMRRRRTEEKVQRLRIDRTPDLDELASKAARWTTDHLEVLSNADPDVPAALNDRAADNWRPLLAIADAAGGEWPVIARKAALALAGEQEDDSIGVLLLQDIRVIFDDRSADRLPSNDLAHALAALQDRPWSEWRKGKPLTANALSRLLKPFSIVPGSIRVGMGSKDTPKGYKREQFEDAWSRYTSVPADSAFQNATTPHPNESAVFRENQTATNDSMWRFENARNANESEACGVVADRKGVTPAHRRDSHDSASKSEHKPRSPVAQTNRKFKGEL